MQMKFRKKLSSFFLCMMLIVAMAFMATGCNDTHKSSANADTDTAVSTDTNAEVSTATSSDAASDITILGDGSTSFLFTVTDTDGKSTQFEIHSDKTTVGDALLELGLIAGDESEYGLYVKTVNGITVDYDTDGKYWAFYINEEYSTIGVDATPITAGSNYLFKVQK